MARPIQATTPSQIDLESKFPPPPISNFAILYPLCLYGAAALCAAWQICTSPAGGKITCPRVPGLPDLSGVRICFTVLVGTAVYKICNWMAYGEARNAYDTGKQEAADLLSRQIKGCNELFRNKPYDLAACIEKYVNEFNETIKRLTDAWEKYVNSSRGFGENQPPGIGEVPMQ